MWISAANSDDLVMRHMDGDERVGDETVYIPCVSIIEISCSV